MESDEFSEVDGYEDESDTGYFGGDFGVDCDAFAEFDHAEDENFEDFEPMVFGPGSGEADPGDGFVYA